jgi:nicotinic acid mononucleotide adenylyltransferase
MSKWRINNEQWKIDRDPFYSKLFEKYGLEYLKDIGFFFDSSQSDTPISAFDNVLCTGVSMIDTSKKYTKPCVLLATGSFCPIHDGHVDMMKQAKQALQQRGWDVLGGYFSPGHEQYVEYKTGSKYIETFERIDIINNKIKNEPWLRVDPWEAVFNSVAVNFTDVILRLKSYLKSVTGLDIDVVYVCGSDNARFAATFEFEGNCVVVNRPQANVNASHYFHFANDRVIFCDGFNSESSSNIRKSKIEKTVLPTSLSLITSGHPLDSQIFEEFELNFIDVKCIAPDSITVSESEGKFISLDASCKLPHNLGISRYYDIFGMNLDRYDSRPGTLPLDQQCANIPIGSYSLYDSDIFTGSTVEFVKNLLVKKGYDITSSVANVYKRPNREILDSKDFIIDAPDGGLVVQLPNGTITRAPYILPYVNCRARCGVADPILFSMSMWTINYLYYKVNPTTVEQLGDNKQLFLSVGFTLTDSLELVCRWHIGLLASTLFRYNNDNK